MKPNGLLHDGACSGPLRSIRISSQAKKIFSSCRTNASRISDLNGIRVVSYKSYLSSNDKTKPYCGSFFSDTVLVRRAFQSNTSDSLFSSKPASSANQSNLMILRHNKNFETKVVRCNAFSPLALESSLIDIVH